MKQIFTVTLSFLLIQMRSMAQDSLHQRPAFHVISSLGVANGSKGMAYLLQAVPGILFHNSFAGVGIGIDDYKMRSVPLFLDFRQEFGRRSRNLFVYADAGCNFDWLTEKDKTEEDQWYGNLNFRGGIYYDAGLGYNIHFSRKDVMLFSIGYSVKEMHAKGSAWNCTSNGCSMTPTTLNYHMPRLALKAGWRF